MGKPGVADMQKVHEAMRKQRFLLIRDTYGSVDQFVNSCEDSSVEYLIFSSSRNREALVRSIQVRYGEWLAKNPTPIALEGARSNDLQRAGRRPLPSEPIPRTQPKTLAAARARAREDRFLLIRHRYKTVAKFVGSRTDWWAECDLFDCARDRKVLVRSIEQRYTEWLRTPQSRRAIPPRERVFARILAEFGGSARAYVKSRQNLQTDYVLFKSSHDPKVLTKRMQQQYDKWRKNLPKNRGSVLVADGRALVDDGSLSPGWRSSSVRTVSGGLPSLGRRR